ncbi:hypothetical protein QUC31_005655, partial [Theobroma cacao]
MVNLSSAFMVDSGKHGIAATVMFYFGVSENSENESKELILFSLYQCIFFAMEGAAGSVMDSILGSLFHYLLDKLSSPDLMRFARQEQLLTQLKKLEKLLRQINALLADAEEKQTTSPAVKHWLSDLKDVAYDADDVIDELATEALRRELMAEPGSSMATSKVWKFIPTCFSPSVIKFSSKIGSKIEEITGRLQYIAALKNDFNLVEDAGERRQKRTMFLWHKGAGLHNITCLECLKIEGCSQFPSFAENEKDLPCSFGDTNCGNWEKLPCGLQGLMSLKNLHIESCPKLVSFAGTGLPPTLRVLKLKNCSALKYLPDWMMMSSCKSNECFEELEIEGCPLTSFPRLFPTSLRKLKIRDCNDLQSLPEGMMQTENSTSNMPLLENLEIVDCSSLISFPEGKLPTSLKVLKISDCLQLDPIFDRTLHNGASLEYISIWNNKNLTRLPKCLCSLTCLKELSIGNCPSLESFPVTVLPFPKLRELDIFNCINLNGFNANTDSDFRRKIESKIEEITVRLQGLVEKKKDLKLGPNCGRRRERVVQQRLPTTSLVNESHIYGREKDKEAVIQLLKSTGEVGIVRVCGFWCWKGSSRSQYSREDEKRNAGSSLLLLEDKMEVIVASVSDAQPSASTSKLWKVILPTCFSALNLNGIKFNAKMNSKIQEITSRLHDLAVLKNNLNLVEFSGGRREKVLHRLPTSSLVDEPHVYGRESDKDAIVDMLMDSGEMGRGEVGVVSIVGMAGVGKTTLAQLVYHDERIETSFELRAWACVTEEFDILRVTKTVLHAVDSDIGNSQDLNLLQVRLKEKLIGRKFLIILDDLWNENYGDWDVLCKPFAAGAPGSKILVTTRHKRVAAVTAVTANNEAYHLKELSDDACLSLFTWHALRAGNFDGHPNLKVVGEQIVRKCKGLPLAAKTLGGLLRTKVTQEEWEDILMSKIWDLPEERSGILPALRLSYHHLPFYLKQCFAYCAIFPKDYEFDKDELVLLWMAEGFLQQLKGKTRMEDLGSQYFNELLSRSIFQQSTSNKARYVMHDLINDLAQSVSDEICSSLDDMDMVEGDKLCTVAEKVRHLSFTRRQAKSMPELQFVQNDIAQFPGTLKFLVISNCIGLTSLWQKGAISLNISCLESLKIKGRSQFVSLAENDQGLSSNLEDLRLLDSCNVWNPPWMMHGLTSLKDLQIESCPNLVFFPELGFLHTLKHLKLKDCRALKSLPSGMMMLNCKINGCPLEELEIEDCHSLTCFPRGRLPTTLKCIRIRYCRDLMSLPEGLMLIDNSASNISLLEILEIVACPSLISFPEGRLPTSLKNLKIWNCSQLEPISDRMLHKNASLESIDVWNYFLDNHVDHEVDWSHLSSPK